MRPPPNLESGPNAGGRASPRAGGTPLKSSQAALVYGVRASPSVRIYIVLKSVRFHWRFFARAFSLTRAGNSKSVHFHW